ncbi:hypothetical protein SLA2020_434310 [Shorea laevis]
MQYGPSPLGQSDYLVWRGTATGVFTVKSAYHMAKEGQRLLKGETSTVAHTGWIWQKLWKLNVPATVKSFFWRVCNNALPTRENLCEKKIILDPSCPICGLVPESIVHVLWSCPAATTVWMECTRKVQKLSFSVFDGFSLTESLMSLPDDADLEVVLFIARRLWLRRNAVIFGDSITHPFQFVKQCHAAFEEFRLATAVSDSIPSSESLPPLSIPLWQKPAPGTLKTNWDAAVDVRRNCMGVGVIIRDATGNVIAAQSSSFPNITDPAVAESFGLWQAVSLCKDLELSQIHFEGDASEIVHALLQQTPCRTHYGHLIESARTSLNSLHQWSISHVRREANEAAHRLAKAAISNSLNVVWQDSYPDFIHSIVLAEQVSFSG